MPSGTATSFGRLHVAEPWHHLDLVHRHPGTPLHEAVHQIPLGVLDQEDFGVQGIDTSRLIKGAPRVDALGNCVFNAGTAAVSCLGLTAFTRWIEKLGLTPSSTGVSLFGDTKLGEEAAIVGYHEGTDQTGDTASEWPPTDCGSSGVYLVQLLKALGIVTNQKIATTGQDIVSLMQTSPVLVGGPWFNSWMNPPGPLAVVDGNGTSTDLENAINSGVAGGHERLEFQVETLVLDQAGQVVPEKTVLVDRNSWSRSWGDDGCYRIHLSTHVWLSNYCDWRSLVA